MGPWDNDRVPCAVERNGAGAFSGRAKFLQSHAASLWFCEKENAEISGFTAARFAGGSAGPDRTDPAFGIAPARRPDEVEQSWRFSGLACFPASPAIRFSMPT